MVLQETAVEAEKSVIQQLKGKSDLSKVKSILQSTKTQARDKLIISKSYHTFIDEQVKSGKTEDEAKKIAENRLNQAAQVLAMRAFSQQVKQ
ncbi:MAG: hypothetical protein Q8O99_01705 [bacterium]|nr:hypothetical protein [bacterium]